MTIHWRSIQLQNFRSWEKLASFLEIPLEQKAQFLAHPKFPLNLPMRLAEKIKKGDMSDPILLQFLPRIEEQNQTSGFSLDPVQDAQFQRGSKLLHKYKGRALLLSTSACAMHCRYCFRQNYPYEVERKDFAEEIKIIREDSSLHEIILSGGDPLSLSDENLKQLLEDLSSISHIRRIRFHTRFPIGIPERIDASFLELLRNTPKQIYFVIHTNHPKELDHDVLDALKQIQRLGIPVLNQAVLLKEVNDSAQILEELFLTLSDHGILPYYLHQLDRVQGASHFEVPIEKGKEILHFLTGRLSGYCIPKFVQEIAKEPSKTQIVHNAISAL